MEIDQQKRKTLIEWVNSLGVRQCIESLRELKDGRHLISVVGLIDGDVRMEDDSTDSDRFSAIIAFLENRFKASLRCKIDVDDILDHGKEFELAKICLLLLSAGVMSGNELFIERAQKLELILQYEVKEMVECVGSSQDFETEDGTSFYHILTQSLNFGVQIQPPQMSSTPQSTQNNARREHCTPGPNPGNPLAAHNKGTPLVFSTSLQSNTSNASFLGRFMSPRPGLYGRPFTPMSPIQQLVHSPGVANRILLQQKEQELRKLNRQLNSERHVNMELDAELKEARDTIEKKEQRINELQKQNSKYRRQTLTLQEDVDQLHGIKQEKESLEQEVLRKQAVSRKAKELLEEQKSWERENADYLEKIAQLEQKVAALAKYKLQNEPVVKAYEQLKASQEELERSLAENRSSVSELTHENQVLRFDLLKLKEEYHARCEELKRRAEASVSFQSDVGECLAGVVEIKYQEDMSVLQTEIADLKVRLCETQAECQAKCMELGSKTAECETLLSAKTELEGGAKKLQRQIQAHEEKITCLQQRLSQSEASMAELKQGAMEAKSSFVAQIEGLQSRLWDAEGRNEQLVTAGQTLEAQCTEVQRQLATERENSATKLGDLEGHLQQVLADVRTHEETVRVLRQQHRELEQRSAAMTEEKETKCRDMEQRLEGKDKTISEMSAELDKASTRCGGLQTEMTSLRESSEVTVTDLKNRLLAAQQLSTELKGTVQGLQERCSQLQQQAESSELEKKRLGQEQEKLNSERASLQESLCLLRQESANFQQQSAQNAERLETTVNSLKEKVEQQQREASELQLDFTKVSNLNIELQQKLEMSKEATETAIAKNESTVTRYEDLLKQETIKVGQLQSTIQETIAAKAEMENKAGLMQKSLEEQVNESRNELQMASGKIAELQSALESSQAAHRNIQEEIASVKQNADGELRELQQQLDGVRASKDKLQKYVETLEVERSNLQEQVQLLETESERKASQLEQLKRELIAERNSQGANAEAMNRHLKEERTEKSALMSEIESLKTNVAESGSAEKQAKRKADELEEMLQHLKEKNSELQQTVELSGSDLDRAQVAEKEAKEKVNELEIVLGGLRERNTELNRVVEFSQFKVEELEKQLCLQSEEWESRVTEEQGKVKELIGQMRGLEESRKALEEKSAQCESERLAENRQNEATVKVMEATLQKVKDEYSGLEQELDGCRMKCSTLEQQAKATQEMYERKIEEFGHKLQKANAKNSELQTALDSFTSRCCTFEEQVRLAKEVSDMKIAEYMDKIEDAEKRNVELQGTVRSLESERKCLEDSMKSMKLSQGTKISELEDKLRSANEENFSLEQQVASANRTTQVTMSEIERKLQGANERNSELEAAVESFRTKCVSFEQQIHLAKQATSAKIEDFEQKLQQEYAKNSKLQTTADMFSEKINMLGVELATKQKSFEENERCKQEYKSELADTQRRMGEVTRELDSRKVKVASMESHLENFCHKLELMNADLVKSHEDYVAMETTLKRERSDHKRKTQEFQLSLDDANNRLENMNEELRREKCRSDSLENQLQDAEAVISNMEDKLQGYENKMQNLESTLNQTNFQTSQVEESFKVELKSAQDRNGELRSELDQAYAAVSEFEEKLLGLQSKLVKLDEELISSKTKRTELEKKCEKSEKAKQSAEKDLKIGQEKCKFLENECSKWQKKWEDAASLIENTQKRNADLEDKFRRTFSELEGSAAKLASSQQRLAKLEEDVRGAEARASDAGKASRAELHEAHQREEALERQLAQALREAEEAEGARHRCERRVTEARERCESLEKKYSEMKSSYAQACEQLKKDSSMQHKFETLKATMLKYKKQMGDYDKREKQYSDVIDKYKAQNERNEKHIASLEKQLDESTERKNGFEERYQQMDVDLTALKQQLHEQEHTNKNLNSEIRSLTTQLDFAYRQLRVKKDEDEQGKKTRSLHASCDSRRAVSERDLGHDLARDLPGNRGTRLSTASSLSLASEPDRDESMESCDGLRLEDLKSEPKAVFKTPSAPNLRRETRSSYSRSTTSLYESRLTKSQHVEGSSTMTRSQRLSSSSTVSAFFRPTRSAGVPRGLGALLSSEEEPDLLDEFGRLSEMQRRNTLCLPHMKSSYPVETQARPTDELGEEKIQRGTPVEQMISPDTNDSRRRGRKRLSTSRGESADARQSFESSGDNNSKRQAKEPRLEGKVFTLGTPGVKLYKQYSPRTRGQLDRRDRTQTPGSKFNTANLKHALEEAAAESVSSTPPRALRSSAMRAAARGNTPQGHLRGLRGNTPQGSLSKLRKWAKGRTPMRRTPSRRTPRKQASSSDENDMGELKQKKSLTFSISVTPKKNSRFLLRDLAASKKTNKVRQMTNLFERNRKIEPSPLSYSGDNDGDHSEDALYMGRVVEGRPPTYRKNSVAASLFQTPRESTSAKNSYDPDRQHRPKQEYRQHSPSQGCEQHSAVRGYAQHSRARARAETTRATQLHDSGSPIHLQRLSLSGEGSTALPEHAQVKSVISSASTGCSQSEPDLRCSAGHHTSSVSLQTSSVSSRAALDRFRGEESTDSGYGVTHGPSPLPARVFRDNAPPQATASPRYEGRKRAKITDSAYFSPIQIQDYERSPKRVLGGEPEGVVARKRSRLQELFACSPFRLDKSSKSPKARRNIFANSPFKSSSRAHSKRHGLPESERKLAPLAFIGDSMNASQYYNKDKFLQRRQLFEEAAQQSPTVGTPRLRLEQP